MIMKLKTFLAVGFWSLALPGYVWDLLFTSIGNKIVGIELEDL